MHRDARRRVRAGVSGMDGRRALAGTRDRRFRRVTPALEPLEGRRLLSFYTGPTARRPLLAHAGAFLVEVSGPGVVEVHPAPGGAIDLTAYGTTTSSTITITQTEPRFHAPSQLLLIRDLRIRSGELGGLSAMTAELDGRLTPLTGPLQTLAFGMIGPKAQVDVNGNVDSLDVANINLGPTGHVTITGDVNSIAQSGTTGTGTSGTTGTGTSGTTGTGTSATTTTIGAINIVGGRFSIGRDLLSSFTIDGDVTISHDGSFSIGRDQDGTFAVDGSLLLSTGGQIVIGRNLTSLAVSGNLIVQPSGSGIAVDGALQSLSVNGYLLGQGGTSNPSAIDVGVGLNLSGLTILGGISGQGGLINANIRVGGSVSGVDIPYGTTKSTIQSNATMPT